MSALPALSLEMVRGSLASWRMRAMAYNALGELEPIDLSGLTGDDITLTGRLTPRAAEPLFVRNIGGGITPDADQSANIGWMDVAVAVEDTEGLGGSADVSVGIELMVVDATHVEVGTLLVLQSPRVGPTDPP